MLVIVSFGSGYASSASLWANVSEITDLRAFTEQVENHVIVPQFSNPHKCAQSGVATILQNDSNN